MKKFSKLIRFLEKYQDIWDHLSTLDYEYPIMDVSGKLRNEDSDFGFDFSKDQSVWELFFGGSSDYFVGLCFPKDKDPKTINYDECPIYVFDSESLDESLDGNENEGGCQLVGNFKTMITDSLNFIIKNDPNLEKNKSLNRKVHRCLEKIMSSDFSDILMDYRYQVKGETERYQCKK